jgi:hypothetical protein
MPRHPLIELCEKVAIPQNAKEQAIHEKDSFARVLLRKSLGENVFEDPKLAEAGLDII